MPGTQDSLALATVAVLGQPPGAARPSAPGRTGMPGSHFLFKLTAIERSRLSAFLALDECGADCFNIGLACLIAADQVADIFAVIGELSGCNLRLYPVVLLIGDCDCFPCCAHKTASKGLRGKSYY